MINYLTCFKKRENKLLLKFKCDSKIKKKRNKNEKKVFKILKKHKK